MKSIEKRIRLKLDWLRDETIHSELVTLIFFRIRAQTARRNNKRTVVLRRKVV